VLTQPFWRQKKALGEGGGASVKDAFPPRHRAALPRILWPSPPGASWDHEIKADAQKSKGSYHEPEDEEILETL